MAEPTNKPGRIRIVSKKSEDGFGQLTRVYFVRELDDGTEQLEDLSEKIHGVAFRHIAGNLSEISLTMYDAEIQVDGADETRAEHASLEVMKRYGAPQRFDFRRPDEPRPLTPADADKLAALPIEVLDDHLRESGLSMEASVAHRHVAPNAPQLLREWDGLTEQARTALVEEHEHQSALAMLRRQADFRGWVVRTNTASPEKAGVLGARLDAIDGGGTEGT